MLRSCVRVVNRLEYRSGRWLLVGSHPVSTLLLRFADYISRDGRVEDDGVVAEALRRLVALPTAALERLSHPDLGSVAILGVVLDTVHILQGEGTHGKSEFPHQ